MAKGRQGQNTVEGEQRDVARGKTHDKAAQELVDAVEHAPSEGKAVRDILGLDEIFTRVLATADAELSASSSVLFWSGLAAGLALGLSFIARAIFASLTPTETSGLVHNLFYPIGFVLIVLGRYQLFTENTLTPVTLVLTRLSSLGGLLRLWGVVYASNMLGALAIALLLARSEVFEPAAVTTALHFATVALTHSWAALFSKALIAGWLVAGMVWLVHSARDSISRLALVWIVMYLVGAAGFYHCVTSSVEVFFAAFRGQANFWRLWPDFILPVTLGNTVGGIVFVAVLNYAQFGTDQGGFAGRETRLSWREWLSGRRQR